MPSVIVVRGAGDKRGEDIVDPLLCTVEVQLARGKTELDLHAAMPQTVNLTTVFRAGVEDGQLVEVHDAMQGMSYRSKIAGVSHRIDGGKVNTVLDLLRPTEDLV